MFGRDQSNDIPAFAIGLVAVLLKLICSHVAAWGTPAMVEQHGDGCSGCESFLLDMDEDEQVMRFTGMEQTNDLVWVAPKPHSTLGACKASPSRSH